MTTHASINDTIFCPNAKCVDQVGTVRFMAVLKIHIDLVKAKADGARQVFKYLRNISKGQYKMEMATSAMLNVIIDKC